MTCLRTLPFPTFLFALLLAWKTPLAHGQDQTPVAVDESPTASMLVQRILDQIDDNVGEAARGCRSLLSLLGPRLIPISDDEPDRFTTVRNRINALLVDNPLLLERFREVQGPAVDRLFEEGAFEEAMAIGWLTPSGMKAAMVVAQEKLEAGHLPQARRLLEELAGHPDLEGREARFHLYMLGLVLHLQGEHARADEVRAELALEPASSDLVERLAFLQDSMSPFQSQGVSTMDVHRAESSSEEGWHRIWSGGMPSSAFSRSRGLRLESGSSNALGLIESDRVSAGSLTSIPLVLDEVIVISDGSTVRSFDRFGTDFGWSTNIASGPERRSGLITDLSEVSVAGDSLYTISGLGYTTGRTSQHGVVCLDLPTGEERWRTRIDTIRADAVVAGDPGEAVRQELDLEGAFPYGPVILADGMAVVLARKVNSRRETIVYLIGLDAGTGSVRWVRLLASSGGVRTQRGFARMIPHQDSVIVASPVGIMARVEASTGDPVWLRRFKVPLSTSNYGTPWEIGQPAVVGDDLYALAPDASAVIRLDVETGELLEEWPAGRGTTWGTPRYLVGVEEDDRGGTIYAVGEDVAAFSATSPGTPLWRMSETARDEVRSRTGFISRLGNRGRIHFTGNELLVPGVDDILVLDSEDGRVLERIDVRGPSHPVLLDSQLILGGLDQVESLMKIEPAERFLRERIKRDPDNAGRPLALLELGIQSGRTDLALEAADITMGILETDPESTSGSEIRGALVDMLLRLQEQSAELDLDVAERAVALADQVARTPRQHAQVMLATGDLLASNGALSEAVDVWSGILADPQLADTPIQRDQGMQRARLLVEQRLVEEEVRTLLEEEGSDALDALGTRETVATFERIGRLHVGTSASAEAWLRAIRAHEASGRLDDAASAALEAIRSNPLEPSLLLEAILLHERHDWSLGAEGLLDRGLQISQLRPEIRLAIQQALPTMQIGRVDHVRLGEDLGDALEFPGRLVRDQSRGSIPGDALVMIRDRTLEYRRSPADIEPRWTHDLESRDPGMISISDEELLLWITPTTDTPYAIAFSIEDGAEVWRTPPVSELMGPPPNNRLVQRGRQGMMPGGRIYRPQEIVPLVAGETFLMVRRSGQVVALDRGNRNDVSDVRWKVESGLERVYEAVLTDRRLILAGMARELQPENAETVLGPGLSVIDLESGTVTGTFRGTLGGEPRWLLVDPAGRLVIGTRDGIEAFPMKGDGAPIWTNETLLAGGTVRAIAHGNTIVAARPEGSLMGFNLRDGRVMPGAFVLSESDGEVSSGLVELRNDADGVYALMDQRLIRFSDEGDVTGMDAIDGPVAYSGWVSAAGREFVVDAIARNIRDGSYRYLIHRLDPERGFSIAAPSLDLAFSRQRLEQLKAVDGWLILGTSSSVLAIPMPVEADGDPLSRMGDG